MYCCQIVEINISQFPTSANLNVLISEHQIATTTIRRAHEFIENGFLGDTAKQVRAPVGVRP